MATFLPSTNPASFRPCRKGSTIYAKPVAGVLLRNPITGIAGCCARDRQRPRGRRTAEKRDEFPPPHPGHGDPPIASRHRRSYGTAAAGICRARARRPHSSAAVNHVNLFSSDRALTRSAVSRPSEKEL